MARVPPSESLLEIPTVLIYTYSHLKETLLPVFNLKWSFKDWKGQVPLSSVFLATVLLSALETELFL